MPGMAVRLPGHGVTSIRRVGGMSNPKTLLAAAGVILAILLPRPEVVTPGQSGSALGLLNDQFSVSLTVICPGLVARPDLRHMVKRKIAWLIAAIWVAIALILWLSVLGPSNLPVILAEPVNAEMEPDASDGHTQQPARFTVDNATAEDLGRLGKAIMAFASADLELPGLDIWFHTDRGLCAEHLGLFKTTSESWQVRICSSDIPTVYEHELAHAWVAANVDDSQRSAFMNLRDLEYWAGSDVPWNERGTEWAAIVIQQGLSGLPLPPALSNEAKSRLESYELLTGRVAPVLVNWIRGRDVPCSDRPTELSRPITDRNGRACELSRPVSGPVPIVGLDRNGPARISPIP